MTTLANMPTTYDDFLYSLPKGGEYRTIAHNTAAYRSDGVVGDGAAFHVLLHGHEIAIVTERTVWIRDCGYVTTTTYDRLKRLVQPLGAKVSRRKGVGLLHTRGGDTLAIGDGYWTAVVA